MKQVLRELINFIWFRKEINLHYSVRNIGYKNPVLFNMYLGNRFIN